MLLEFRVSNFRSFAEEQTFSLVASPDNLHERVNLIERQGQRVLKTAAVYGANASGKSNLVKALQFVKQFVSKSATQMTLGDPIDLSPFRLSKDYADRPSEFHFALLIDGTRYDYGFSATSERVHDEWIVAYPKNRASKWLERNYDADSDSYEWSCRGPLAKDARGLEERTRANGLALSRGAERNIGSLEPLFLWFKNKLRVLDQSVVSSSLQYTMPFSLDLFRQNEEFRSYLGRMISDADMGIVALGVAQKEVSHVELPEGLSEEERDRVLSALKNGTFVSWVSKHLNRASGEIADLRFEDEAAGTQRLLAFGGPLWDTLQRGYTLIVDELDCSLHPHLVRKLIQLFQSPEQNQSGAQLVFVTHDSTLMDLSLLRRDQIWLVEKGPTGASEMYSLWDFKQKPRKEEAIQRGYLGGRYGGVPNFGPTLESVE